jgi:hypothetical protein
MCPANMEGRPCGDDADTTCANLKSASLACGGSALGTRSAATFGSYCGDAFGFFAILVNNWAWILHEDGVSPYSGYEADSKNL